MPTLHSVNVGLPKNVPWNDEIVFTSVWKTPVDGPRMVRRLNIDGDGQGDLHGHGGEHRAVFVYQLDSYRYWQEFLGRSAIETGQFGENFTVDGLTDDTVCIGDRYQIGEALFEVTQPRVTCFRLGMRMAEPRMPALVVAHHRPGFYFRVITEGLVAPGDDIVKTHSGEGQVSVAEADALLYLPNRDPARLAVAAAIPALSQGWRQSFLELLAPAPVPTGWPGFRLFRVSRVQVETADVTSIYLRGDVSTPPVPGQYLTVRVPIGDRREVRSYSISGWRPGEYRISVKQEPHGAVSRYLHQTVAVGGAIEIASPRGEFVLDDGDEPVLLVSAGIGATPVLAMLAHLAAAASARQVWWIHVARDEQLHVFAAEAHGLIARLSDGHERTFHTATESRPDATALGALGLPSIASAYLCGPDAFMTDMTAALISLGMAPTAIHSEIFGARSAINPGVLAADHPEPHQPPGPPGAGPLVTFARSGLGVHWAPQQRTILELAEACDVPTRWSCRTGVCHTCSTAVLSGDTAYMTEPLELPPAGEVLICCAAPTDDLVLDL
ncbi:MOSC and FAD-binding oxidoreductase domain-containing protein [Mycolicibacterium komossense]|uniref:MOSC domain-containing protein n=1 Tax=Mycolicibacterium komossense TaxID=1779 RepID=A0ABT3C8Q2_9MYCO|nr:MOSC and FAD-binding oxidoreductase domain-containing protein [Mycolicibacterium komossense]MCV7225791.1 MOSC domain-containing protein [Mycolicibacterium komossense]